MLSFLPLIGAALYFPRTLWNLIIRISANLYSHLWWIELCTFQIYVYLEPHIETLFGNRVLVDELTKDLQIMSTWIYGDFLIQ